VSLERSTRMGVGMTIYDDICETVFAADLSQIKRFVIARGLQASLSDKTYYVLSSPYEFVYLNGGT
jgi:hypothetical protein